MCIPGVWAWGEGPCWTRGSPFGMNEPSTHMCPMCRMVLKEMELKDFDGHPKKVFLVVMGAVVLVSLTHLATTLNVEVAKASIHHQLERVGAPTHLCDSHTLKEAKGVGMVDTHSRAFRLVPLDVMQRVVDAFPMYWGFLKAPLQLMGSLSLHHPSRMAMPTIPTPHATLTSAHIIPPSIEVGATIEAWLCPPHHLIHNNVCMWHHQPCHACALPSVFFIHLIPNPFTTSSGHLSTLACRVVGHSPPPPMPHLAPMSSTQW